MSALGCPAGNDPDHLWAYDSVHDICRDGRRLKVLAVEHEFECLAIEVERRMAAAATVCQVVRRARHAGVRKE